MRKNFLRLQVIKIFEPIRQGEGPEFSIFVFLRQKQFLKSYTQLKLSEKLNLTLSDTAFELRSILCSEVKLLQFVQKHKVNPYGI